MNRARKNHWMQDTVNPAHKGLLREKLGIPQGVISDTAGLVKDEHSKPRI